MNKSQIKTSLRRLGVTPSKLKGQNFLADTFISELIASRGIEFFSRVCSGKIEALVEVGPGLGAITKYLLEEEVPFRVVELEHNFAEFLKQKYSGDLGPTQIVNSSILELTPEDIFPSQQYDKICLISNLPYSISSEMIQWLILHRERFSAVSLLLQKEFALKLAAKPGSKLYGSLSIFAQVYAEIQISLEIEGEHFFPEAKVSSSLLMLDLGKKSLLEREGVEESESQNFQSFVRAAFSKRRKTLMNNLRQYLGEESKKKFLEIVEDSGYSNTVRAEELSPKDFIMLFKKL